MELPDGRLAVGSHIMFREAQELLKSQPFHLTVAKPGAMRSLLPTMVITDFAKAQLSSSTAAKNRLCHARKPLRRCAQFCSFLSGQWAHLECPQMCPFALHRPYVRQLEDGRCMVTGRHVNGGSWLLCLDWRPQKRSGNICHRWSPQKIQCNTQ